ncbi:NADPH:quinone oxidoreductase family protein [Piscinibacter sakaiensis]|uniref:Putative Zn-dependent oxidoreductase PA5234 n=1 Tax=Piscinibacter sakaiensis TaxID=1547922 RepID=A0A0K8P6G2_PISS1|nr:NADPH:quinone oxidoreductase family protein [Piscinibacter sakaiensis]GAP38124.1 putative Zn-dependent oxidoreductase PA5234 [Piscinibacter sakaiensis]
MKALRVHGYGPDDRIVLDDLPVPEPRAGEVRVRVEACGISFVDLLVARGGYQVRPTPPFVPGSEFSGVVDAIGPGTPTGLKPGDRVCGSRQGAWAEAICLPATAVFAVADDAPFVQTAVLMAPYGTALYALRERGQLRAGDTLLVLGAAGSVGHAAIQLGRALGARVIAVASSVAKRTAAREAGAEAAIDATSDWKDEVKRITGPRGVDVVLDPVGGDATDTAFRTLGWGGRHLMVGFAAGGIHALKTNLPLVKGASLVGVDFRQAGERDPATTLAVKQDIIGYYGAGRIEPLIRHVLPVARFDEAAALLGHRATLGRVVFTFGDAD